MPKKKRKKRSTAKQLARSVPALDARSAGLLFDEEEIARIKLAVLTGVNPAVKIEAIRKLAFTNVDKAERGALYLKGITDPDASVRQEAAGALQTLGMSREFGDTLSTLASGTAAQKRLAVSKLKAGVGSLTDAEQSIALAFLGASLSFEQEAEIRAGMLEALTEVIGATGVPAGGLAALLGAVIKSVAEDYQRGVGPARRFFDRLAGVKEADAPVVLWNEVRPIEDRHLRLFLMAQLLKLSMERALRGEVAKSVAQTISNDTMDDLEARELRTAFTGLGDVAIEAMLPLAQDAGEDRLPGLIGMLDATGKAASAAGRRKVAEFFLKLWPNSGRTVRAAIMEARINSENNIPARIKNELARQAINSLHTFETRQRGDIVWAALRRLGAPVLQALRESIERSPYPEEREAAAQIIVDICASSDVEEKKLVELVGLFRGQETGKRIPPGRAVRCGGRLVHLLRRNKQLAREVVASYRSRLGRVSYMGDLLVALCYAASSPAAERRDAAEMMLRITEFLGGKLPDPKYEERKSDEGTVIVIGRTADLYTELIPDLLKGIQLLYASEHVTEHLRRQVVEQLLVIWGRIVRYEEVWAPGNLLHLADTLAMMGGLSGGESRVLILRALVESIRNTSIVRAAARLCGDEEEQSDDYAKLMGSIGSELFRMLGKAEYRELGDRRAILITLGHIAGSARIGTDPTQSNELRARIMERIAEEGTPTAREMTQLIEWLKACKTIPDELKTFGARRPRRS